MATGVIIILLLLGAIVLFVKATNHGQNFWSYVIVAAAAFLVITFVYVSTFPGVSLTSLEGLAQLGKTYFLWLGKIGGNLMHLTGNAVKLDWSVNSTGG